MNRFSRFEIVFHDDGSIIRDLPRETELLARYDRFRGESKASWNGGALSTRAREKEFASLTAEEAAAAETAYRETFGSVG